MTRQVVVVIDDLNDIGSIERRLLELYASEDAGFHIVSAGAHGPAPASETIPCRMRLMLLLARLADRLIPVTGEVVLGTKAGPIAAAIARHTPDEILVASQAGRLRRWLRRDLASQLRRMFDIDVQLMPAAA